MRLSAPLLLPENRTKFYRAAIQGRPYYLQGDLVMFTLVCRATKDGQAFALTCSQSLLPRLFSSHFYWLFAMSISSVREFKTLLATPETLRLAPAFMRSNPARKLSNLQQ
jgi:hypothetical protein